MDFITASSSAFSCPSTPLTPASERCKDDLALSRKQPKKNKYYWPKIFEDEKAKTPKPSTPRPRRPPRPRNAKLPKHAPPVGDAGVEGLKASVRRPLDFNPPVIETIVQLDEGNGSRVGNSADIPFVFSQSEKQIQFTSLPQVEKVAANHPCGTKDTGCLHNSLKVYQRRFRRNQCASNSRRMGPIFPRMWKRKRGIRQRAANLSSVKASEDGVGRKNIPIRNTLLYISWKNIKKRSVNSRKAAKLGNSWPVKVADVAENERRGKNNLALRTSERLFASHLQADDSGAGRTISPKTAQSWAEDNDPISFDCVRSLTPLTTSKKKRSNSKDSTQRLHLGPKTLITGCNQLLAAPPQPLILAENEKTVTKSQNEVGLFLENAIPEGVPSEGVSPTLESLGLLDGSSKAMEDVINLADQHITNDWGEHIMQNQETCGLGLQDDFSKAFMDVEILVNKHCSNEGGQFSVQNKNAYGLLDEFLEAVPDVVIPQNLHNSNSNEVGQLIVQNQNAHSAVVPHSRKKKKAKVDEGGQLIVQNQNAHSAVVLHSRKKKMVKVDEGGQLIVQNQNAHSAVVLHSRKKDKEKDKDGGQVELDPETLKIWNLLIASGGEDFGEGGDKNKEEWWEEQRKVFMGRVESFLAHMQEIQGNRRFSRWKGSVVDSIVGVFLTQNTSDKLSSFAFLSLAAKYPLRRTTQKACSEEGEVSYNQESVGSNAEAIEKTVDANINPSLAFLTELDQSLGNATSDEAEDNTPVPVPVPDEAEDNTSVPDEFSPPPDAVTDGNPPTGTCELSTLGCNCCASMRVSCSANLVDHSSNRILSDPNGTLSCVSADVGCGESSGTETILQQKATPRAEEVPVDLSEWSSHAQVNQAKGKGQRSTTVQPKKQKKSKGEEMQEKKVDWDDLRKTYSETGSATETRSDTADSVDWEAVRQATVDEVAYVIKKRGQNNTLAKRIKDFLDRVVRDHGSLNLEWLRKVPAAKAKDYILSIVGLGLKSVECLRLLTLLQNAFPVDTNVGRVAVRLGWVPLQPLPDSLQFHKLDKYPPMDNIQKYLWPRLCTLNPEILYELHYQLITFGKVFCTKTKPNCSACPMKRECKHYESELASLRTALQWQQEESRESSLVHDSIKAVEQAIEALIQNTCEGPIIEFPPSPKHPCTDTLMRDIEDLGLDSDEYIPFIRLDTPKVHQHLNPVSVGETSKALVILRTEAASIPARKLKESSRLNTVHEVYELPDFHPILEGMDEREPDDPCPYLFAIWTADETGNLPEPTRKLGNSQGSEPCHEPSCCSGDNIQEQCSCINVQDQIVQTVCGTILIPCRTATRGSFPLNGTYFQINEVFAEHGSSYRPREVPRYWIWNLRRRSVYFGSSASGIVSGFTINKIRDCFQEGYICLRGFDFKSRTPTDLAERFHESASSKGKKASVKRKSQQEKDTLSQRTNQGTDQGMESNISEGGAGLGEDTSLSQVKKKTVKITQFVRRERE